MKSQNSIKELNRITEQLIRSSETIADKATKDWRDSWTRERKEVKVLTVDGKDAVVFM